MSSIEAVGLGALNMDHIYQVERILDDGETVAKGSVAAPGGSAANTIYGLARLGVSSGFASVVGDDAEGQILLDDFQRVGVDMSRIKIKPGAKTGSTLCLSDSLGKRSLYVLPEANSLLAMNDLDLAYINQARVLHLSSFVDDRQFKISLELMEKLDSALKVSFSPGALYAIKGLKELKPILARTHVLFINQDEIRQLTAEDIDTGAESCLKCGCRIVAVTLGKGTRWKTVTATSYIRDAEHEYIVEAGNKRMASTLDTTGAGDAFASGFLYGLLNGKGIEECGRLGSLVAQFSITRMGARQGLPNASELSQGYRKLYGKGQ